MIGVACLCFFFLREIPGGLWINTPQYVIDCRLTPLAPPHPLPFVLMYFYQVTNQRDAREGICADHLTRGAGRNLIDLRLPSGICIK